MAPAKVDVLYTGPWKEQVAGLIVGQLDGRGLEGAGYAELLYAMNPGLVPVNLPLPELKGRRYALHPVHRSPQAADKRPAEAAHWNPDRGALTVPARTALVYVLDKE